MQDQTVPYSSWQARKMYFYSRKFVSTRYRPTQRYQGTGHIFFDCKHKHMMKSGAPPDKVRVLHRLLPIEFHGFTSRIDF